MAIGQFTSSEEIMAKKVKDKIQQEQELHVLPKSTAPYDLVVAWAENHSCDRFTVGKVGHDKFRVNLYTESGEIIRVSNLTRSFFLVVTNGIIEDKTIRTP